MITDYKLALVLSMAILPNHASSQDYDFFNRQAALYHASTLGMLWLGAAQGIVERCGGDVSRLGQDYVYFTDIVEDAKGRELALVYAGTFGEGIRLGNSYGCDVDKLADFETLAVFYLNPAIQEYTQ